jgi:glycosyltransferase involved in cell wall biosynthesis
VEAAAVEIAEFRLRSFQSPSTMAQLISFARWCRSRRLAVLHACDFYANVFALPGAALAGVPLRIGSRRDLVLPGRSRAQHALQQWAYRFAHRVVANSGAAAQQLQREAVPADRIVVVPNGIDLRRHAPAAPRRTRRIVTTVANLRPEKGHDVLLEAAALVLRQRPDVVFQLVGGGPMRDPLERQAADLAIDGAIRFLGHRDDVPEVLAGSDLFALPSRSEAFPNGVIEAMAAGLPIVASDVGGIPEVVSREVNGLLVPVGDAMALAAALLALLNDPSRAAQMGMAARQAIERGYSFDRMVATFEQLYLAGRGPLSSSLPIPSRAAG